MASGNPSSELLAVYDLGISPATFDFFNFLVAAEIERRRRRLGGLHVAFVPAAQDDAFNVFGFDARQTEWRLLNILHPGTALMPSCKRVSLLGARAQARSLIEAADHVFPTGYAVDAPVGRYERAELAVAWATGLEIPSLAAPPEALKYVETFLDGRAGGLKAVTLMFRRTTYNTMRNSDVSVWADFARDLEDRGYFPVVIPDTDSTLGPPLEELDGLTVLGEAAFNLLIRAALFEQSFCVVSPGTGPNEICQLDHAVSYLYFIVPHMHSVDSNPTGIQGTLGIGLGGQFPYAGPHQKLVWRKETREALNEEFEKFVDFAEGRLSAEAYKPGPIQSPGDVADVLAQNKRHVQAQEIYEHLLQAAPGDAELMLQIAVQENERERFAEALAWLVRVRDEGLDHWAVHEQMGKAYSGLGRGADAIAAFERAIALGEADDGTVIRLAVLLGCELFDRSRGEDALAHGKGYLERFPDDPLLLRFLGEIAEKREDGPDASEFFIHELAVLEQRLEEEGASADLVLRAATLDNRLGRFAAAGFRLELLSTTEAERWDIQEQLGDALAGLGRNDEAVTHYQKAVALSWQRRAYPFFRLAQLKMAAGDMAEAERNARECLHLAPDHAPNCQLLSDILIALGEVAEAMELRIRARAAEIAPG